MTKRPLYTFFTVSLLVAMAALAACSTDQAKPPAAASALNPTVAPPAGPTAHIARVVDGDTVVLDDSSTIRIIGVDTPETVKPGAPVDCYGPEASARTKALLPEGTEVRLTLGAEAHDKYGRTLAYLWRASDGLFIEAALASEGMARQLTIPPNVAYADVIAANITQAQAAKRGLWAACG